MKDIMTHCPLCNSELVVCRDRNYTFRFRGEDHVLSGLARLVCKGCSAGLSSRETAQENEAKIRQFQNKIAGEMSPADVLELREKYCLSQQQAARIFMTPIRAFSKWERGEVGPAASTARMLRMALEQPEFMRMLAEKAGENIDIPPVQQMVPHAQLVALEDKLARRDNEERGRIRAAYAAGQQSALGHQRIFEVNLTSSFSQQISYGQSESSDEVPLDLLICQKEKQFQRRRK